MLDAVCSFSSGEPQTHAAGDGRPLRPRGGGAPGADGVRGRQGHQRLGILRGQEGNSADLLFLPHVLCGYHVAVMSAGGRRGSLESHYCVNWVRERGCDDDEGKLISFCFHC